MCSSCSSGGEGFWLAHHDSPEQFNHCSTDPDQGALDTARCPVLFKLGQYLQPGDECEMKPSLWVAEGQASATRMQCVQAAAAVLHSGLWHAWHAMHNAWQVLHAAGMRNSNSAHAPCNSAAHRFGHSQGFAIRSKRPACQILTLQAAIS